MSTLWIVLGVEWLFNLNLGVYGVYPRDISGLTGIVTSPLLHADFSHLFNNSGPLLLLGTMILFTYRDVAYKVFILVYAMSGLGVWLFARESYHIGASGLVYGLLSFLFFSGVFRFDAKSIAVALFVAFWYGSFVLGILPQDNHISWESHLLGTVAGAGCAWIFRKVNPPKQYEWEDEEETPSGEFEYWNYRNWPK